MAAHLDVAESVRVDGKPRQIIVLYLERLSLIGPGLLSFWLNAWKRIVENDLSTDTRRRIADLLLTHGPALSFPLKPRTIQLAGMRRGV